MAGRPCHAPESLGSWETAVTSVLSRVNLRFHMWLFTMNRGSGDSPGPVIAG